MDWKTLLAYITGSVDQELLLRNEYLVTENRLLRNQMQGRVRLTDGERKTLAEIGQRLGRHALAEIATIVKPDTILAWHRKLVAQNLTVLLCARPQAVRRSMRSWRPWWCAWQKKIVAGATIASQEPWHIWGTP